MKTIQSRHANSHRSSEASQNNKENVSTNFHQKGTASKADTRKIGQEIKHKITKMPNTKLTVLTERHAQKRSPSPKRHNDKPSLNKSVSFDSEEGERSPRLLRHNSNKSILKNSLNKLRSSITLKSSQVSLANSHVGCQDQSTDHAIGNRTIMEKYHRKMAELRQFSQKYTDEVYPPNQSSIYLNNSLMRNFCLMQERQGRAVEWIRLPELFRNKQIILWTTNASEKCTVASGPLSRSSDYLPGAFNLVGQKNSLLERMFEGQGVSPEGIYFVKIHMTQQSIWKYVIIDDYVPVLVNKRLPIAQRYEPSNLHPAFLSVLPSDGPIELWPFLLQKAYAKYYSTFDSLANGSLYDFVEEVTGSFLETIHTNAPLEKLVNIMRNEDAVLLGEDRKGALHPLRSIQGQNATFFDREQGFADRSLPIEALSVKFQAIHFTLLHRYPLSSKCQVQQEHVRTRGEHEGVILRHFSLQEGCECQVGVVQKQQRFYRALLTYEYAWMRLVLVQQESNGYRWISSAYSNQKSVKISANLTTGNYILIIMPEWKQKRYDFQLLFFGTYPTFFQRKSYEAHRNILQESCMDLAQRFGQLVQINRSLCSYHYIDRTAGLIIENINNEKEIGSVRVMRSIQGLQAYAIRAHNPQFSGKKTIQATIAPMGHFTVVLMTFGGINQSIFNMFDFGCHPNP